MLRAFYRAFHNIVSDTENKVMYGIYLCLCHEILKCDV